MQLGDDVIGGGDDCYPKKSVRASRPRRRGGSREALRGRARVFPRGDGPVFRRAPRERQRRLALVRALHLDATHARAGGAESVAERKAVAGAAERAAPRNREPLSDAGGVEQVEHVAVREHLPRGDREPTSRVRARRLFGEERSDDARRQTRAVALVRAAAVPEKRPRLAAAALAVCDDDGVEAPVQPVRDVAPHRVGDAAARSDAVQAVPAGAARGGVRRCRRQVSVVPSDDAVAVGPRAHPRLVGVVHLEKRPRARPGDRLVHRADHLALGLARGGPSQRRGARRGGTHRAVDGRDAHGDVLGAAQGLELLGEGASVVHGERARRVARGGALLRGHRPRPRLGAAEVSDAPAGVPI